MRRDFDPPTTLAAKARVVLWVEFLALFVGGPLLILHFRRPGLLFLALWLGGVVTHRLSRPAAPPPPATLRAIMHRLSWLAPLRLGLLLALFAPPPNETERRRQRAARAIWRRFLILGALITLATRLAMPAQFLGLPRERPVLWLAIMLLYPLLSVWPQEVIYRRFLFHRYAALFPAPVALIAASALAFGFAHIIFLNPLAIIMTTAGGAMFAFDYARHRDLGLACLEHSLYGCLIFTVGLGRFFYTGAAWHS